MAGGAGRIAAAVLAAVMMPGAAFAQAPSAAPATPQVKVETLKAGAGEKPPAHSYVLINYKGMLPNGTVFDQAEQTPMPLDEVVPGFAQGLVQMQRGGRYKLTIPPELGYGARASGPIPANSTLVFEIDLIDFKTAEEIAAMMAQMQAQAGQAAPSPAQ